METINCCRLAVASVLTWMGFDLDALVFLLMVTAAHTVKVRIYQRHRQTLDHPHHSPPGRNLMDVCLMQSRLLQNFRLQLLPGLRYFTSGGSWLLPSPCQFVSIGGLLFYRGLCGRWVFSYLEKKLSFRLFGISWARWMYVCVHK